MGLDKASSEPSARPAVSRPRELPAALTWSLHADSPLRDRLCFIAHADTTVTAALFAALPEPTDADTSAAMRMTRNVARIAAHSRRLAALLRPDDTRDGPTYFGTYKLVVHLGDADEVERWLRDRGLRLVHAREVLDDLLVIFVRAATRSLPAGRLAVLRAVDGRLVDEVFEFAEPGVFALERAGVTEGPVTLRVDGGHAHLDSLPASGCFSVTIASKKSKPRRVTARVVAPPSTVDASLEGWLSLLFNDDGFVIEDLNRFRDALADIEREVGSDAARAALRSALARRDASGRRYARLTVAERPDPTRCVACSRPIRGAHYLLRCDIGHETVAHRGCARDHVARRLGDRVREPPQCSPAGGCHLISCARSEVFGDPKAARLLREMCTTGAQKNAESRILVAMISARLVEEAIAWTAHSAYLRATDESGARAFIDAQIAALDAPAAFCARVRETLHRRLALR